MKPEKEPPAYTVRRVHLEKTEQLDRLAHACGEVYTNTVVSFWRTVRKKGIWLKPKHLMRWHHSNQLHAHTADACVQAFCASLASWRELRKTNPHAHPPRRRKWYFRIEYKRSAMRRRDGKLHLSNGRGNDPLVLEWPYALPQTLVIRWAGECYERSEPTCTMGQLKPQARRLQVLILARSTWPSLTTESTPTS